MPGREQERRAATPPRNHKEPRREEQQKASSENKKRLIKDKTDAKQMTAGQESKVKLKSTIVDIDSVREDKLKNRSLALLEAAEQENGLKRKNLGLFEWLLMVFVFAMVLLFFPISIWFCVKVVREHERAMIFRLGHLLQGKPRGPGLLFYLPFLDVCHKVDIRLRVLKVPLHQVVTKDLSRPELSMVCYYQIENVALCCATLTNPTSALQSVVQAAVRDVLAQHSFSHILAQRRRIGEQLKVAVDSVACRWGIKMERTDIDELFLPVELQQSLAAEAEVKRHEQTRMNATESEMAAWDGFRASPRLLHPALVFPFSSDILNMNSDFMSLPPPPPPPMEEEQGTAAEELHRDSPMM